MKTTLVVFMWIGMVLLYLIINSILRAAMGMSGLYGIVTALVGYGLWVLGRKLSRNIRK